MSLITPNLISLRSDTPRTFLFEDFRQKLDRLLPRPASSKLHHPPPSLANCGTAETGEIFRAVGGVWQGRYHQRRARRAEEASFSVLVSNLDFRVPRLRQRGERVADRAVQRRKRDRPRGPESRPGLPRRSRPARSGPGAARAWIQVSARERGIPLLDGVFPARTGNPNRRHRLRHAPDLGLAMGR